MFRAYTLGVDAAFGNEHPNELQRLYRAFQRGLIQFAFDKGKSRASDVCDAQSYTPEEDPYELEPSDYDWELWDQLVTERREGEDAFELVRVERFHDFLPVALDRPNLLERRDDTVDSIRLPRFLLR